AVMFFITSRRRHTRFSRDWSSDVCSSDLSSTAEFCGVGNGLQRRKLVGQSLCEYPDFFSQTGRRCWLSMCTGQHRNFSPFQCQIYRKCVVYGMIVLHIERLMI